MLTSDFDYDLPTELIAAHPAARGASRLLVVDTDGERSQRSFSDLPQLLRGGDLLVLNNTRVLAARLFATKRQSGAKIDVLVTERLRHRTWSALVKPAKRLRLGTTLDFDAGLTAHVLRQGGDGSVDLRFSQPLEPLLEQIGHVPLPPYIQRADTAEDRRRYQTVFAKHPGAIAAPTAGLHFSCEILDELRQGGIEVVELTLHVGPGTFKPVRTRDVEEHPMHAERYSLGPRTARSIAAAQAASRRVIAVGTTVVRALESAALQGSGTVRSGAGRTRLFILPGFRFQVVDLLLTNFHLPRSTLFMLVCAFAGRASIRSAYREAIRSGYRFYSYGDAMLLERSAPA